MKEIKAIIRPFKLIDVVNELQKIENLPGVTVSDIRGFGKSKAQDAQVKIVDGLVAYVPKVKIEVVVSNEMADEVINTIQKFAHTGNPGDGKIYVYTVDNIVKIRTNERGIQAI